MIRPISVLRTGGIYTVDYAHRLARQVQHCWPAGETVALDLLTDVDSSRFDQAIATPLLMQKRWAGWWSKIELFSIPGNDILLYFDLDTLLVAELKPIIAAVTKALETHDLVMLDDFNSRGGLASGVMAWRPSSAIRAMYTDFCKQPRELMREYYGDQKYIDQTVKLFGITTARLQDLVPGCVVSYKKHAQESVPKGAAIVCFHGVPKPHELNGSSWGAKHWKRFE